MHRQRRRHSTVWMWALASLCAALAQVPDAPTPAGPVSTRAELAATEAQLRDYLKAHSDSADAHYRLAYTLFREAKARESLTEYTAAAALRTPTAKELQTVALDYVLLNDYSDADRWMTRAVEEQSPNAETWYELGRIKYTLNRFAESIQCFQRSLELEPKSVKAENNLGLALEGINRDEDAIAAYRQAMAWQKDAPHPSEQPLVNLAILLANRGNMEEAVALIVEADRLAPEDPKISEQMGRIYTRLGRLPEAQRALEKAAALKPESAAIHYELAQVYRKQGKAEEAKAEFARTAALNGTHSTSPQP